MALVFPVSPTVNDVHTAGALSWRWDGVKWVSEGGAVSGADTATITSEALAAGDLVNIWNSGGAKARKADATTAGKEAHGFVLAAFGSGVPAAVYFEGTNTAVTGLTPGPQFLNTTAGAASSTAPSGSGNVVQRVGVAVSATAFNFQLNSPIVLA